MMGKIRCKAVCHEFNVSCNLWSPVISDLTLATKPMLLVSGYLQTPTAETITSRLQSVISIVQGGTPTIKTHHGRINHGTKPRSEDRSRGGTNARSEIAE
jgi:hypothetical protein